LLNRIPIVKQFIINYQDFVNNSARIEESYKELQIVETKLSKHIIELKDDISKKTKFIDSLSNEKDTLTQNNQSLEERVKELRTEVDKFNKKESSGGLSKNRDYGANHGLNLGKSM